MAIKGMAQLRRNVRKQLTLAIPSHAERAMHIATSIIGGYATLMTPVDATNLINSQYRIVKNEGRRVVAAIGYTARYAAAVHEMSGKLKGEMLNPLFNQSESYSKATTLSGVFARVPTKISL